MIPKLTAATTTHQTAPRPLPDWMAVAACGTVDVLVLAGASLITYTQDGESGASLRAAGFQPTVHRRAHHGWNRPSRPRTDQVRPVARTRWELTRSTRTPSRGCVQDICGHPLDPAPIGSAPARGGSRAGGTSGTNHSRPST